MASFVCSGAVMKIDCESGAHSIESIQLSNAGARRRVCPVARSAIHSSHRSDSYDGRDCERQAIHLPSGE